MKCPKCSKDRSSVVDSRGDGGSIRRRRECQECGFRFTTFERVEYVLPLVVKKDGRREAFDSRKLRAGLLRACEKRPVSVELIDKTVERIERRVQELCEKEVQSRLIGEFLIEELRDLDQIAYVRFASVYQEFSDIQQFVETLKGLGSGRLKSRNVKEMSAEPTLGATSEPQGKI